MTRVHAVGVPVVAVVVVVEEVEEPLAGSVVGGSGVVEVALPGIVVAVAVAVVVAEVEPVAGTAGDHEVADGAAVVVVGVGSAHSLRST